MYDFWIKFRNNCLAFLYKFFAKPLFFVQDPEEVHDRMTKVGKSLGAWALGRGLTSFLFNYSHSSLRQEIAGIEFKNPIGLAAGFDKNAELTQVLPSVGFGFEEVGSVTGEYCPGNPKPRLWRLKESEGLLVYYGLKNDGAEKIVPRLKKLKFQFPLGISLAKTNSPQTVDEKAGIEDYFKALKIFSQAGVGDYYTINISCPNAFGGEPFLEPGKLDRLFAKLGEVKNPKPVFLKLQADLKESELDALVKVARKYNVTGLICTNLTKNRANAQIKENNLPSVGGVSGRPVRDISDRMIEYLYQTTGKEFILVGCGGVFTAQDAYRKIRLGASLIQLITGMVFRGPQVISQINQGLVSLLQRDGFKNISEAVGTGIHR
jgi:dihydroorotate dehydrogenase